MPDTNLPRTVYIVDDDAAIRDALALLLSLRGYTTAIFASAEDFLHALPPSGSERAFARLGDGRGMRGPAAAALEALSPRERQALALVVDGVGNRGIGERLGSSPRTVEVHKARILARVGARNLAALIRICRDARLGT